jgi:hypothetical protein
MDRDPHPNVMTPAAVYRLYRFDGTLEYIGCTRDLTNRMRAHRRTRPAVNHNLTTVDWFETIEEARAAERAAIVAELPPGNVHYKPAALRGVRLGRPRGYRVNPDALTAIIGDRTRWSVAQGAGVSPAFLSQMVHDGKGASRETAERIAAFLNVRPGALFPELAEHARFVVVTDDEAVA